MLLPILAVGLAIVAYALAESKGGKTSADGSFVAHDPTATTPAWAEFTERGASDAHDALSRLTVVSADYSSGLPGDTEIWHLMPLDPSAASETPSANTILATQIADILTPWNVWFDSSGHTQLILTPVSDGPMTAPFALLTTSKKGWHS